MTAINSLKMSTYMKQLIASADPPSKACTVKKMNGRLLLLLSIKTTNYFKQKTNASGVLKKVYCVYKNVMLHIDPLNSSCS